MALFPAQTIEAVGACVRTMDGPEDADAVLAKSDASTLSGLRAAGDRLALRSRFHDERAHRQHRPADAVAGDIFDALELARLDALGARWLHGVAQNLVAHPGREQDGLRWLAFELFSETSAPKEKRALVDAARAALPHDLVDQLRALGDDLLRHTR